jgi:hypothetical protein
MANAAAAATQAPSKSKHARGPLREADPARPWAAMQSACEVVGRSRAVQADRAGLVQLGRRRIRPIAACVFFSFFILNNIQICCKVQNFVQDSFDLRKL